MNTMYVNSKGLEDRVTLSELNIISDGHVRTGKVELATDVDFSPQKKCLLSRPRASTFSCVCWRQPKPSSGTTQHQNKEPTSPRTYKCVACYRIPMTLPPGRMLVSETVS